MFEEPELPFKGFKKIYCICAIKKSFQICKFSKLLWHLTVGTMFRDDCNTYSISDLDWESGSGSRQVKIVPPIEREK
jgi:hypothetical protein